MEKQKLELEKMMETKIREAKEEVIHLMMF